MTTRSKTRGRTPIRASRAMILAAALVAALSVTAVAAVSIIEQANDGQAAVVALFGNDGKYAEGPAVIEYDESGQLATNLPAWSKEAVDAETAERLIAPYLYALRENTFNVGDFSYTIDAVLYDSSTNATMVYWSVENPNGLGDFEVGPNGEVFLLETSSMRWAVGGKNYLDTANSSENLLRVCSYDVGATAHITAQFGMCLDPENGKHAKDFDIQEVVIPRHDMGGMRSLTLADGITVSPVAIRFEKAEVANLSELAISFNDGSEYVVLDDDPAIDNTAYGLTDDQDALTYAFNRIVDIDAVEEIKVNE